MGRPQPKTYLFHVDFKWPRGLALWTGAWLNLLILTLVEGSQDKATLEAVILDHIELWEDPSAAGHHTTRPDELVQMKLPEELNNYTHDIVCGTKLEVENKHYSVHQYRRKLHPRGQCLALLLSLLGCAMVLLL